MVCSAFAPVMGYGSFVSSLLFYTIIFAAASSGTVSYLNAAVIQHSSLDFRLIVEHLGAFQNHLIVICKGRTDGLGAAAGNIAAVGI